MRKLFLFIPIFLLGLMFTSCSTSEEDTEIFEEKIERQSTGGDGSDNPSPLDDD